MDLAKSTRIGLAHANQSRAWLSRELEVSKQYVSDICNGTYDPSTSKIEDLAAIFGVSVSEFIKWGE
jgi:transcriptional regulator with XRE-family HTH domain